MTLGRRCHPSMVIGLFLLPLLLPSLLAVCIVSFCTIDNSATQLLAASEVGAPIRTSPLGTATPTCGPAWRLVASQNPSSQANYLKGVSAVSINDAWAVGTYLANTSRHGVTLAEHWDGTQWSVIPSPNAGSLANQLIGVAAISSNDVWAVGSRTDVGLTGERTLIEHWDGTQWSVIPSPNPSPSSTNVLRAISAVSSNDVWA